MTRSIDGVEPEVRRERVAQDVAASLAWLPWFYRLPIRAFLAALAAVTRLGATATRAVAGHMPLAGSLERLIRTLSFYALFDAADAGPPPRSRSAGHDVRAPERCQYLVIGSGAGGSVAALELAEAGKDVVVVEEGPRVPTSGYSNRIGEMTRLLYRSAGVQPFWGRPTIAFAEGRCVGGGTVINGGLLWRTPPWVLDEWQREHGVEGFGSEELAPHFAKVETLLNVSFHPDEINANLDSQALAQACGDLGWRYVPAPRAVDMCRNSNFCPTGCPTGAKQSTLLTYLPRAMRAGARVLSGAQAISVERSGARAGAVTLRTGAGEEARHVRVVPDHVVVAAGAIQTPFLLRRSGLSATAGRGLQFHLNFKLVALFDRELDAVRGTIFTGQVQEFEHDGLLIMASTFQPPYLTSALAPYGNRAVASILEQQARVGLFVGQIRARSLGRVHSFLRSAPLVTYSFDPRDLESVRFAYVKMAELLFTAGAVELYPAIRGVEPARSLADVDRQIADLDARALDLISVHAMSTCPLGGDAQRSLVDTTGSLRGFENVLVSDASVLPSNLGESPQGTIMAVAHRIFERHLRE